MIYFFETVMQILKYVKMTVNLFYLWSK